MMSLENDFFTSGAGVFFETWTGDIFYEVTLFFGAGAMNGDWKSVFVVLGNSERLRVAPDFSRALESEGKGL